MGLDEEEVVKILSENRMEKGEKNRKEERKKKENYKILVLKSDYSCVEHKI